MKNLKFLGTAIFFCIIFLRSNAQTTALQNIGINSGIHGLFINPANIANTNYKWDVNIFTVGINMGFTADQTLAGLAKKGVKGNSINNFIKIDGTISGDITGPSAMFSITENNAVALSNRYRLLASGENLGGQFDQNKTDSFLSLKSYTVQKININAWKEFAITYAATIAQSETRKITAGITTKYIYGASNSYLRATNLSGTLFFGNNEYVTNTNGRMEIGNSDDENERPVGRGFGTDIGFVFEKKYDAKAKHPVNTAYKYRVGVSIMDLGFVTYTANNNTLADYNVHIPANEKVYIKDLEGKKLPELRSFFSANPRLFSNNNPKQTNYKASLPTTAIINFDYAIIKNLYVDLSTQVNLVNKSDLYSGHLPNKISVTTRYETKIGAIFLPVSYNDISGFNVGIGAKIGAFYISSNSIISGVLGKSNQIDLHAGLKFAIKKRKMS